MRTTTTYECEFCGKEFYKQESAEECEASHRLITVEELKTDIERVRLAISEGERFSSLGYDTDTINSINRALLSDMYRELSEAMKA